MEGKVRNSLNGGSNVGSRLNFNEYPIHVSNVNAILPRPQTKYPRIIEGIWNCSYPSYLRYAHKVLVYQYLVD